MYHIYQTEGFIIESEGRREADRFFNIFTKDLGMIRASAGGIRLLQSKLRYSLQDLSYSKISMVRGKDSWRITNAEVIDNISDLFFREENKREKLLVFGRIFALLARLLHGEEKNENLFEAVLSALEFFKKEKISCREVRNAEAIIVLRILKSLGYMAEKEKFKIFVSSFDFDKEILSKMEALRGEAFEEINKSLRESHL